MSGYNSNLSGKTVVSAVDKALSAVQPNEIATVAKSGNYNDLSGKPSIPTEDTVSGWGVTKNAGTITGVTMNGVSKGSSGVVDLGAVITAHQDISGKVDKVAGKQLSTEDFTSSLKAKLEGLSNYDDSTISSAVNNLQQSLNTLLNDNPNNAINSFNEIIAFLDGVKDSEDLSGIISSIEGQIAKKQDTISDLATIRSGAALGATALQSYTEKYQGTVTGVKMNGSTKNQSNGIVDLGTVITAHQDISGKQNTISDLETIRSGASKGATAVQPSALATVATSGNYNDLSNKPSIPAEQVNADWNATSGKAQILNKPTIPSTVTESTVSGWGFTKNTGTYSKPSGGIPKSDLANDVQTSLGKADSARQSHQSLSHLATKDELNNLVRGYKAINHGTGDTSYAITPNVYHIWGEVATLTLTYGSEVDGFANEYLFQFSSGATPTTLSLPASIKWANDTALEIEADKTYSVSIVNNLAVFATFAR